ncbi:MAG: hypothetical protein AMXMBFR44_5390 [Candidatus Campbellbacteria bacterium]
MDFITRQDRNIKDGFPPNAGLLLEESVQDPDDEGPRSSNRAVAVRLPADDEESD